MIEFKSISKRYYSKLALNNVSFNINDGEIFGIIGHNGAGKSTLIKSLVSIINTSGGEIFIDDLSIAKNRFECKQKIYYIPDNPDLFLTMSALEYWSLVADAYNISNEEKENRIEKYSKLFNMEQEIYSPIESFSHGMRQKTFIIASLIANPKIWVMDEPLTGLDPQSAFDLKALMKEHIKNGNIVLFSTHILEVAEHLCDRIGILSKGNLIFVGTLEELKEKYEGDNLESIYINLIKNINLESEK